MVFPQGGKTLYNYSNQIFTRQPFFKKIFTFPFR